MAWGRSHRAASSQKVTQRKMMSHLIEKSLRWLGFETWSSDGPVVSEGDVGRFARDPALGRRTGGQDAMKSLLVMGFVFASATLVSSTVPLSGTAGLGRAVGLDAGPFGVAIDSGRACLAAIIGAWLSLPFCQCSIHREPPLRWQSCSRFQASPGCRSPTHSPRRRIVRCAITLRENRPLPTTEVPLARVDLPLSRVAPDKGAGTVFSVRRKK